MVELLFALLAGALTIASPCILPVLPIILGASLTPGSRQRPAFIALGFVLTFSATALVLGALTDALGWSADSLHNAAVVLLLFFGVMMLAPSIFEKLTQRLSGLINRVNAIGTNGGSGNIGGFILGMTLGIVWTPCAGPILGSILTLIATSHQSGKGFVLITSYAIGASIPMMLIAYGGQYMIGHVRGLSRYSRKIQQGFGLAIILVAVALYLQYDVLINAQFSSLFEPI